MLPLYIQLLEIWLKRYIKVHLVSRNCTYHVQQKGEGQKKYPKVKVEAVGEGALVGVHIPASGE